MHPTRRQHWMASLQKIRGLRVVVCRRRDSELNTDLKIVLTLSGSCGWPPVFIPSTPNGVQFGGADQCLNAFSSVSMPLAKQDFGDGLWVSEIRKSSSAHPRVRMRDTVHMQHYRLVVASLCLAAAMGACWAQ